MNESGTRRKRVVALVLSGVFPGLGQPIKGLGLLVAGVALSWMLGAAVPTDPRALAQPGASLLVPLCVLLAIWLWACVDAWLTAGRHAA